MKLYNRLLKPVTIGVRAVIQNSDNNVLLVQHTYSRQWFLPGGGLNKSETLLAALEREMLEELGLEYANLPRLLGTYTNIYECKRDFVSVFIIDSFVIKPQENNEIEKWNFFSLNSLPQDISPGTRRRLQEFNNEKVINYIW